MMNRVLLRYELLGLARDTRTVVLSVLLPIVLLPILLFTLHRFGQQRLSGGGEDYHFGRERPSRGLELVSETVFSKAPFAETLVKNNDEMLADGSIDFVLKVGQPDKADPKLVQDISKAFPGLAFLIHPAKAGRPVIELLYRSDRDRSVRAYLAAQDRLLQFRESLLKEFFERSKVEVGFGLTAQDKSSDQERAARRYGPALSAFMVLILLGGGSVAALDSLAGERERGTLSTLFLSSLPRATILWTKFCAVALISVLVALIQMANLGVYVLLGWMEIPLQAGAAQWLGILLSLTLLFLSEALFTAALLLYISARSSSFKEAQLFFFPAFLIAFALSLSGLMPGLPSHSAVSLIPLAGPGLLIPEILASRMNPAVLLLQLAVHLLLAFWLLRSTLSYVGREEFLGGQAPTFGKALVFERFSQRALLFYALLGASLMVVPSNFAGLSTLQGQSIFNQLILFVLGPLLLLKLYGQKIGRAIPRRSISLRLLLLCLFMIPLGQVAATGLSHLLGPLLPPPVKAMEEMVKLLDLENTPSWQVYLLIGVLPGFCEEFAFRGVLMYALHRRFSPWTLAAVVAVVFGFFHLSFYRVIPTAFMGFFLGVMTLATGSLLPAVIVHVGNNSLAVFAMLRGWDFESLGGLTYASCLLAQVATLALFLRWGRGYPGTRWDRLCQPPGPPNGEAARTGE